MATRTAFRIRPLRIVSSLFCMLCFFAYAHAQHGGGGGGGHSGGGHSGSGHSSAGHTSDTHSSTGHSGHFGWLHFGRGHSGRHTGSASSDNSLLSSPLWNLATPTRVRSIAPTLVWSPSLEPSRDNRASFVSSALHPRSLGVHRFHRHSPSGCFFNGATQVCFFEPLFPLLYCSAGFGFFDYGYGGESADYGDGLNSQVAPGEMPIAPLESQPEENITEGSLPLPSSVQSEAQSLDEGALLLVLKNGTTHAATDYWLADSYLEYISPDGTRSHIPLDALDLERTVTANAPRGLPFVLRSAPAGNR